MFNYNFKIKNNVVLALLWFLLIFLFCKASGCHTGLVFTNLIIFCALLNLVFGFVSYILGFQQHNIKSIAIHFILYVIFCAFWYIFLFYLDGDFKNNFTLIFIIMFFLIVLYLPIYFKMYKKINLFFMYYLLFYSLNFLALFTFMIIYGFTHDC